MLKGSITAERQTLIKQISFRKLCLFPYPQMSKQDEQIKYIVLLTSVSKYPANI